MVSRFAGVLRCAQVQHWTGRGDAHAGASATPAPAPAVGCPPASSTGDAGARRLCCRRRCRPCAELAAVASRGWERPPSNRPETIRTPLGKKKKKRRGGGGAGGTGEAAGGRTDTKRRRHRLQSGWSLACIKRPRSEATGVFCAAPSSCFRFQTRSALSACQSARLFNDFHDTIKKLPRPGEQQRSGLDSSRRTIQSENPTCFFFCPTNKSQIIWASWSRNENQNKGPLRGRVHLAKASQHRDRKGPVARVMLKKRERERSPLKWLQMGQRDVSLFFFLFSIVPFRYFLAPDRLNYGVRRQMRQGIFQLRQPSSTKSNRAIRNSSLPAYKKRPRRRIYHRVRWEIASDGIRHSVRRKEQRTESKLSSVELEGHIIEFVESWSLDSWVSIKLGLQ